MRSLVCVVVAVLVSFVSAEQASAQFPSYGGYGSGYGNSWNNNGWNGSSWNGNGNGLVNSYGVHHDHYCKIPAQPYTQNFGQTFPSYGYGNSYSSNYGNAAPFSQYPTPQVSSYYSNNYYGQPHHSHHGWHPGHYLLGN
jgi:hypothetical protein